MTTEQIYTLVNTVNSQAFGHSALTVSDTSSLISLGNTVLSSSTNTEAFLNTLAQRIGRTILRFREYRNKLGDMVLNDFEYGAILQKIKVNMPEAESDESYDLIDGNTVDHYVIAKPSVDLADDHMDSRQTEREEIFVPAFKRFGQNGMVGIRNRFCDHIPSIIP